LAWRHSSSRQQLLLALSLLVLLVKADIGLLFPGNLSAVARAGPQDLWPNFAQSSCAEKIGRWTESLLRPDGLRPFAPLPFSSRGSANLVAAATPTRHSILSVG